MNILGISAFYHDSAACLVQDGKIIAAAQEERFTRKKHDADYPEQAIQYCLKSGGIQTQDLDLVVFYEKPFVKFERLLESYLAYAPCGLMSFLKAMPVWLKQKLWIKSLIQDKLPGFKDKILFPEHHESHAASAFYPSPYSEAAFLTADGVGEWATASFGVGRGNKLEILSEIHFPHSLGLLYSAFTYYAGFRVNSGEYKLMGLAPYGEAKYKDLILKELIDVKPDGSFRLNLDYFNFVAGLTMTHEKFHKLFGGPPRRPESLITQKDMDLAKSIQEVTEEVMMKIARHIHQVTGMKHLCLSGGVALNCVANGKILRDGPFESLWIQPAAGDAGGALGAALYAWYQYLGNSRTADGKKDAMQGSYLGPHFSRTEIKTYLDERKIPYRELTDAELPKAVADLIAAEKVIGWFAGRLEFGPRALGGRSIIGDARSPKMQEVMNLKIKFRESFRPFAPSVLEEEVSKYFELNQSSPYMLLVAPVQKSLRREMTDSENQKFGIDKLNVVRSAIPAVTHVDYSARIQTVKREVNPAYYDTLKSLRDRHQCATFINTSFNVRGEPLVASPEDAFKCFMRTHMDYLILENFILDKTEQKPLDHDSDWQKEFALD